MSTDHPQVIKRGEDYVVHNVDLSSLSEVQKIALGIEVWDQMQTLMQVNGVYKPRDTSQPNIKTAIGSADDVDRAICKSVGLAAWSSFNRMRPRLLERPDILDRMRKGEFTKKNDVLRTLGLKTISKLEEGRNSTAKFKSSYYGQGDKFDEATEPLMRYLAAWEKKGFRYAHVPPKKAKKRLARIEKLLASLDLVREDIALRSHVATYAAPSEKKRKGDT